MVRLVSDLVKWGLGRRPGLLVGFPNGKPDGVGADLSVVLIFSLDVCRFSSMSTAGEICREGVMVENDIGPYCILRHGRKSHTWGELRQAAQHTMRDPSVSWLGGNIDPARTALNETLVGTGDVVEDVRVRLAAVGLEPKPGQVVARELLVSASHAYFAGTGHSGRDGDWDQDRLVAWKAETLRFFKDEFGDNLTTMTLHLDEAVPHAHVWVTTTVKVEKLGRGRPRKDGTKAVPTMGWTLNHDKVMGSGKEAFAARQDRYAEAMEPLGLQRGQRHSKAHHQPIREFYARIKDHEEAAVEKRVEAHHARNLAIMEEARMASLRQAAELMAVATKCAEQEAALSRRNALAAETAAREAQLRAEAAEQEHLGVLARVQAERDVVEDQKREVRQFLDRRGESAAFDAWAADTRAVANLRRDKGAEWRAYEKSLSAYAADLKLYGEWQNAIVRRADRHLRYLYEVGARALGHSSILRNPARHVADGVMAWLRLDGGDTLVQRHRAVISWLREAWTTANDIAIEEPQRSRGRER